jgi:hypothetical protein
LKAAISDFEHDPDPKRRIGAKVGTGFPEANAKHLSVIMLNQEDGG